MGTHLQELFTGVNTAVTAVVDGLTLATEILDPRQSPQTRLHKLYSVDVQTKNTGKYRDAPARQLRLDSELTLRVAHRLNPKNQTTTQQTAWTDEQNAIIALLTSTEDPFDQTRRKYLRSKRTVNPQREWLFTDITFSLEYDLSLTEAIS